MKSIIFISLITMKLWSLELKNGDILLQPLHCWACSLIEAQEKTEYSHVGIFLKIKNISYVIEAFGEVKIIPLDQFLAKTEKNKRVEVLRFQKIRFANEDLIQEAKKFVGLPYDSAFLWDNLDELGREKIYCSELVFKLFDKYYEKLPLKRMSFDVNREHWIRYFRGNPPDAMWGNSPADFEKSNLFDSLGYL